jgi:hypothetical protein
MQTLLLEEELYPDFLTKQRKHLVKEVLVVKTEEPR